MLALRNTKITRDIATTCNRFYGKTDFTPSTNRTSENVHEDYRYIVSNTSKPAVLPKLDFPPEEPQRLLLSEMRHLQPASQSKFIAVGAEYNPLNVYEPRAENQNKSLIMECPFPRPIIEPQHNAMTFSETSKFRSLNCRGVARQPIRNYSTSPFLMVARGFATKKDDEKCEKPKKKCRKDTKCPHFIPKNCKASKGSDCAHFYIDPKCTKKMAPYKSYSETCHDLLEDDPSECFQCPWTKCRGIESIKPPKKNYHTWRQYSTWMKPHMGTLQTTCSNIALSVPTKQCDVRKKPCKAPPPKCQKKQKKKKCPPAKKDKKKKCTAGGYWTEAYGLWAAKQHIVPCPSWIVASGLNNVPVENPVPQLSVNAHPADCKCNKCKEQCVVDLTQKIVYEMKDCPKDKDKCPPVELPRPPEVDHSIDIGKLAIKEHDKGQPPPCKIRKLPSKRCPKKIKDELPYKRQRDLTHPTYKRNPDPYSDDDLKKN